MTFIHKEGQGTLFKNTYKKEDKHPDWKGTIKLLDGKLLEIAAWEGQTNKGEDKLSVKISEPREKPAQAAPSKEIPF